VTEPNVFLSYRREDSSGHTGWLHSVLAHRLASSKIFWDIDSISPGDDFVDAIDRTIASSSVVLIIVGPKWLEIADSQGRRRLDNAADVHRLEIERALSSKLRVIPVLVGGARMPSEADLPDALKPLARRNAFELSEKRFALDANRLAQELSVQPIGDAAANKTPQATDISSTAAQAPAASKSVDRNAGLRPREASRDVSLPPVAPVPVRSQDKSPAPMKHEASQGEPSSDHEGAGDIRSGGKPVSYYVRVTVLAGGLAAAVLVGMIAWKGRTPSSASSPPTQTGEDSVRVVPADPPTASEEAPRQPATAAGPGCVEIGGNLVCPDTSATARLPTSSKLPRVSRAPTVKPTGAGDPACVDIGGNVVCPETPVANRETKRGKSSPAPGCVEIGGNVVCPEATTSTQPARGGSAGCVQIGGNLICPQ
jgi:hypothetical protein